MATAQESEAAEAIVERSGEKQRSFQLARRSEHPNLAWEVGVRDEDGFRPFASRHAIYYHCLGVDR